ncbi:DUF535 family protein [Dyella sp. 2HG41-7]|uniref:VirK/YbjX family protein n=1 Tax=Dyella sp. 2HG41-7 TaxID=2883239 RepID=UPI001F37E108|nr:DUF535 family protein [Dyella sp. 2HG41-7]
MNKSNQPPAGVLGLGMEAFLPPGVYVPDIRRLPHGTSLAERVRAALLRSGADVLEAWRSRPLANTLQSLRNRQDWTGPWYKRSVTGMKYLVRSACMPVRHTCFLAFVDAHPAMGVYRQRDPRLLERHMHRFINATWRRSDRLNYLQQHYRFALAHLPRDLFERVYVNGHADLGSLTAKDGSLLKLCLRPPILKGCEGELGLQLCDADDVPLYSIIFTVADEKPSLMIGCLQGPRGADARDVVRALTRNLHGMRPKHLMLSLVYAFARHYGIDKLVAISNDAHPLRRSGRPVYSDYDAFWKEQHGRRIGGGWFALPSSQAHKTEAEVPSNHRAAFRRREALRRQAEHMLIQALAQPEPEIQPVPARVPASLRTLSAIVAGSYHGL